MRTGAEIRNIRSVKPKAFVTQEGPDERNSVFVYKIYREKRPNSVLTTEAHLYLSVNCSKDSGKCWLLRQVQWGSELVNENYGKQSWTRREATAHEPQCKKNDDKKT